MSLIALNLFLAALFLSSFITAFVFGPRSTVGSAILVGAVFLSFLITIIYLSRHIINTTRYKATPILPIHTSALDMHVFLPGNAPVVTRSVQRSSHHGHQRHATAPAVFYPTFSTTSRRVDVVEHILQRVERIEDATLATNNTSTATFCRPSNPIAAELNSTMSNIVASQQPTPSTVSVSDSLPSVDSIVRRVRNKFDIAVASPAPTSHSESLPSVDALVRRVHRAITASNPISQVISIPSNVGDILRPTNPIGEMLDSPSETFSPPSRNPLRIVGAALAPSDDSPILALHHSPISINSPSHPNFVSEPRHRLTALDSGPSMPLSISSTPHPWVSSSTPKTSTEVQELERIDVFYRRKHSCDASFDSPSHPNFVPEPLRRSSALSSGPSTPLSFSSTPRPWVPSSVADRWPCRSSPPSTDSPVVFSSGDGPVSLTPSLSLQQWAPALLLDSALKMPEPIQLDSFPPGVVDSPIPSATTPEGNISKDRPGKGTRQLWRKLMRRTTSEVSSNLPA
ncbi:hypothetical protein CONPUDRAFT_164811 [Coniophora puteana RWD-64-598 SS2]|uniref:Uncharacterized protein n=1 Tax=Coniophora puteana (strain RWD-64-598) TaxID=741705 RepID=A0A5M3MTV0_CONPW|nr:uncharacterized protein CONPUDRAFT_164811 [Coniophora puteana RWD-64-598 SS2]EIW82174.1 hypothetical protein CONPUDRAFT_164811 [Coniophora puteana RWD-64-598 SS2]